jgi:hypothetical protein
LPDLDRVMLGEPLWTLQKDGHTAEARVRSIPGVGLELRFSVDGESARIAYTVVGAARALRGARNE